MLRIKASDPRLLILVVLVLFAFLSILFLDIIIKEIPKSTSTPTTLSQNTLSQNTSLPSPSSSSMKCNDDPCNCPTASNFLLGEGGDIGFMYVVAGDTKYAQEFRGVVDHLQNTLHIPDSITRQKDPEKYGRYKYALVTEPHLCKDILLDATSFFDIILTVGNAKETESTNTSTSTLNTNTNTNTNLVIPELIRNPLLQTTSNRHRHRIMLEKNETEKKRKIYHPTNVIGDVYDPYKQDHDLLYWVKSVKATALANGSPFATTIFLDSDNIPCHANFGKQIEDLLEKASFQDSFDIATSMVHNQNSRGYDNNMNNIEHWLNKDQWDEVKWKLDSIREVFLPFNSHNTRTVILNMKSPKTLEFLQRYRNNMVYELRGKIMDQPSFGKAGLSMFLEYGGGSESGFRSMILDYDRFCEHDTKYTRTCKKEDSCILMHKEIRSK